MYPTIDDSATDRVYARLDPPTPKMHWDADVRARRMPRGQRNQGAVTQRTVAGTTSQGFRTAPGRHS